MYSGKRLDDLIEAGWHVVDTEFDAEALYYWRKKALDFLTDFVGPDHACTQSFRDCIKPTEQFDPLDRSDILRLRGMMPHERGRRAKRLFCTELKSAASFLRNRSPRGRRGWLSLISVSCGI
jgi:hypothetical protein